MVAASPRSWSSALCRYARYWISGIGQQPVQPGARAPRPRIGGLVEQRVEDPLGAEPVLQVLGDPVDAALARPRPRRTPARPARPSSASVSAALMVCARVSGPALLGQLAAERLAAGRRARRRRPGSRRRRCAGRRAAAGAGRAGRRPRRREASFGSLSTSSATLRTCQPTSSYRVISSSGVAQPGLDEQPARCRPAGRGPGRADDPRRSGTPPRRPRRRGPSAGPWTGAARRGGGARGPTRAASAAAS